VFQGPCSPDFFTNQNASTFCYRCPDGSQCTSPGTIWPTVCLQGNYRNSTESTICTECPLSSFSYDFNLVSNYLCMPCNAGRMCLLAGTANMSLSTKCSQGEICEEAADTSLHQKCPPGFLCAAGTSPLTKYDIPCIEGFYCPLGTKYLSKYLYPCPDDAYCPPATYDYASFYADPTQNSATSGEYLPTSCPLGTGKVTEGSRGTLLMCGHLKNYTGANPVMEVNPIVVEISANFTEMDNNGQPAYIFSMVPRQEALVTFDLRHISNQSLEYGEDWSISFTIMDSIANGTVLDPVTMPQAFLRPSVDKTYVLEFTIFAWTALDFKVSILIYNGLFQTYGNLFVNTTSVEIFTPNRELFGTTQTFWRRLLKKWLCRLITRTQR
jgi:hypothetical protein